MMRTKTYRASSTVKVQQLDAELSSQLLELRSEIEKKESKHRLSMTYSSIHIPKNASYFRLVRQQVLKRGLQVAAAKPIMSQADIIQKELESCFGQEYTSDSLPLLLHQFFTDRSYQLAQFKYQLMLRWRRFCQHSAILEQMYPQYKELLTHITHEFEDAMERAQRLAASREAGLSDTGCPINVVMQEDVLIYLQWLICHLHSVKTIHSFLHVLHYIPLLERKNNHRTRLQDFTCPGEISGIVGSASEVPFNSVKLDSFKEELQHLLAHFSIQYDIQVIKTSADQMELFEMVSLKFQDIFKCQDMMNTFLQYDSTEATDKKWGRKNPNMALRKNSNWITHIRVKPKKDPWQQKEMSKLKELRCLDELLQMQCRSCENSDILKVTKTLKQHAAFVCEPASMELLSVTLNLTTSVSNIWKSIYNTPPSKECSARTSDKLENSNPEATVKDPKGLPVLSEDLDDIFKDPLAANGAYVSLLFLRHLRIRELKRICLGMLNYLRSVERSLAIDTAGLRLVGGELTASAEETCWMSAARGGSGSVGGLSSHLYIYNTPADYKVHCTEFMEFAEVENLNDYYSTEGKYIHTQDQRGFYIMYDTALRDLQELESTLLLIASHYICKNRVQNRQQSQMNSSSSLGDASTGFLKPGEVHNGSGLDVDRVAVLLDVWTCEAAFLEHKIELLNCYIEAYQHVIDPEQRFRLAQVITNIMHKRPRLDLKAEYVVQAYKDEIACLKSHQQLIKLVLNCQIDQQRLYLDRIWRGKQIKSCPFVYGFPLSYSHKQLVSLGGSSPALKSVYMLELHPSLGLASEVYMALEEAHSRLCQLHEAKSTSQRAGLERIILKQAHFHWHTSATPGASYNSQVQRDLFSDVLIEDPVLVRDLGLSVLRSAEERERKQGRERQLFGVETFSKLAELVTLRHRIVESAIETEHLTQLYKSVCQEMGFDEYHLYMRPVQFEFAVQKETPKPLPLFMTALLQDSSCVDRYCPSSLPLGIQELDENQIGKFSFCSEESVLHLMNPSSLENLRVVLATQITQKNALFGALNLASVCYWAENSVKSFAGQESLTQRTESGPAHTRNRLTGAFVSIQLEKVVQRDEMLNCFAKKKEMTSTLMTNPEEVAKIKRKVIVEFCHKFSLQMSQSCVRAQIIAFCYSLTSLLDQLPDIAQTHFIVGQENEIQRDPDSEKGLQPDSRTFQPRPRRLSSSDGKTLLNLWYIPHYSEVLVMFKALEEKSCCQALQQILKTVSGLHDIVYYLVSLASLGNPKSLLSSDGKLALTADWGGSESIRAELWDIQQQIDSLCEPGSPEAVGNLLQLHREVLLLRFDMAVRCMIREAFLCSGNIDAFQSVNDNMIHALPVLSDSLKQSVSQLPLPQSLEPFSSETQKIYPWRSFLACHGLHPLTFWDILPIEFCMQLSLCDLNDCSRTEANGAMLGVSLLLEDMLRCEKDADPLQLLCQTNSDTTVESEIEVHEGATDDMENVSRNLEEIKAVAQNPIRCLTRQKGFLLLWKQLEVFKESWARRQLGVEQVNTTALYNKFSHLYRMEIYYPSMRALAQHMDRDQEYEILLSHNQDLQPPPGALEVDVKTWQLLRLLESTECDMIRAVQRRINVEMTQVMSEQNRHDTLLPAELWKRPSMKHCLSLERPQMVENFIQQLMAGIKDTEEQVNVSTAHLQECLTELSCAVMNRERSNYLQYSQFYEHLLQQQGQLLYQREQDVRELEAAYVQANDPYSKLAELCRGMMAESTALRTRVIQLEEEQRNARQRLSLEHRERYDALVRQLFSNCIQLKTRLDKYHVRMEQDVKQVISRVRCEGVDKIIKIRNRFPSNRDYEDLGIKLSEKKTLEDLYSENSYLAGLLCKLRAFHHWRQVAEQAKFQKELFQYKQREISCRIEALGVKTKSQNGEMILRKELEAVKMGMMQCKSENDYIKRQIVKQTQQLQDMEHQSVWEARSRQELEGFRRQCVEQLQEDMEQRESQLRALSAQLERRGRENDLQQQRTHKQIKKVQSQLHRERCLKLEAFQRVDTLQNHISNFEPTLSKHSSPIGYKTTSSSRASSRKKSSVGFLLRNNSPTADTVCEFKDSPSEDSDTEPGPRMTTAKRDSGKLLDRPKTSPRRLRVEMPLSNLTDEAASSTYTTFKNLTLGYK